MGGQGAAERQCQRAVTESGVSGVVDCMIRSTAGWVRTANSVGGQVRGTRGVLEAQSHARLAARQGYRSWGPGSMNSSRPQGGATVDVGPVQPAGSQGERRQSGTIGLVAGTVNDPVLSQAKVELRSLRCWSDTSGA